MKAAPVPTYTRVDTGNVVHPRNGILSFKEVGDPDACYRVDLEDTHGQRKQPATEGRSLDGSTDRRSLEQAGLKRRKVDGGSQGLGKGRQSWCFMGTELLSGKKESYGDGWWGRQTTL